MNVLTIQCRMSPSPDQSQTLAETCAAFAGACNALLPLGIANKIRLQHVGYHAIRQQFGLSANLAIRAIARVAAAMKAAKTRGRPPKLFRPTSVEYDARIFAYRAADQSVSLTVRGGRIRIPLLLGAYQREALAGQHPTSATVVRAPHGWAIHIVVEEANAAPITGPALGVDLGLCHTAATSTGTLYPGEARQQFKAKRARVRASLQSKGTRGAKRVLKRLSGFERRRIRYENHVLSRRIVAEAQQAHCGIIRMERLTAIRERTQTWNKHLNRSVAGWSFGQLQSFVAYKARRVGMAVEFVAPAYTSQTCHRCGQKGIRAGSVFKCTTCGEQHADLNAAANIAGGGVVNRPELTTYM